MTAQTDPHPQALGLRVVRGNPTAEELAAVTAVIQAALAEEAAAELEAVESRPTAWAGSQRAIRTPLNRAAGWRGSFA